MKKLIFGSGTRLIGCISDFGIGLQTNDRGVPVFFIFSIDLKVRVKLVILSQKPQAVSKLNDALLEET